MSSSDVSKKRPHDEISSSTLYLDTIARQVLDFDMPHSCKETLSTTNVYCCLVCGIFLSGRGSSTPAYTHALSENHCMFINLSTTRCYVLPDNYEVIDKSLDDIKQSISPRYTTEAIASIDDNTSVSSDVYGTPYLPGFIGLNNLGHTDPLNATIQALAHVPMIRNFFLDMKNFTFVRGTVTHSLGLCIRKLWNPLNLKSGISPQDFVRDVAEASKNKFSVGHTFECISFFTWILNYLSRDLSIARSQAIKSDHQVNDKGIGTNVINEAFEGSIEITETKIEKHREGNSSKAAVTEKVTTTKRTGPFKYLTLDIPEIPLFRKSEKGLTVPQISIFELLDKFNGKSCAENVLNDACTIRKQYRILSFPKHMVLNLARKEVSNVILNKSARNRTAVTFPVRKLEFCTYCGAHDDRFKCPKNWDFDSKEIEELEKLLFENGKSTYEDLKASFGSSTTAASANKYKKALTKALQQLVKHIQTAEYNLVVNLAQDGALNLTTDNADIDSGATKGDMSGNPTASATAPSSNASSSKSTSSNNNLSKVYVQNKASSTWYEIEDLNVKEVSTHTVGLTESDVLIYERI